MPPRETRDSRPETRDPRPKNRDEAGYDSEEPSYLGPFGDHFVENPVDWTCSPITVEPSFRKETICAWGEVEGLSHRSFFVEP